MRNPTGCRASVIDVQCHATRCRPRVSVVRFQTPTSTNIPCVKKYLTKKTNLQETEGQKGHSNKLTE